MVKFGNLIRYIRHEAANVALEEIDILWITAGLSCDGDSVSITAATQPSIEDLVLGNCPVFRGSTCTTPFSPMPTATSFWRRSIKPAPATTLRSSS